MLFTNRHSDKHFSIYDLDEVIVLHGRSINTAALVILNIKNHRELKGRDIAVEDIILKFPRPKKKTVPSGKH